MTDVAEAILPTISVTGNKWVNLMIARNYGNM